MKAALYARVSTDRQETENQLVELRSYCDRQGWEIVAEFVDEDTRGKDRKPQLDAMLLAAHQKRFDTAIFWALDRLTRKGALDALKILDQFAKLGVKFVSFTEPYISTVGPLSDVIIAFIATIAHFEAARISERTRAGLARARADGKRIGRPPRKYPVEPRQLARQRARGASWTNLARKYGLPKTSVRRLCRKGQAELDRGHGKVRGGR